MWFKSLLTSATLVACAAAQFATYSDSDSGGSIAVSVPDATAQSGSGSIFFQITMPSGIQWLAFGTGDAMDDSNMFVVYNSGSTVVVSPRTTSGHNMPRYDSSIQTTLLSGSGQAADGTLVAYVKCDNCLSWNGGSMKATDTSTSWIYAYKKGSALGTTDKSATIQQHDKHKSFSLNLAKAVGGSSSNPFVTSSGTSSAGASGTAASSSGGSRATASSGSSTAVIAVPTATGGTSSSSTETSSSSDNTDTLTSAHGVIMSILFLGAFPLFALTLYLPTANKVRFIHAPLQGLSVILLIVAMALGIVVGSRISELDGYHQIIGFIVVAILVLVQPALGIVQHLHFHKTGGRSMFGPIHQNLGRGVIALGIVNGGIGWHVAGNTGAYIPYAIVAAVITIAYVGIVGWCTYKAKSRRSVPIDKENNTPKGYEMQNTHRRLTSDEVQPVPAYPKQDRV